MPKLFAFFFVFSPTFATAQDLKPSTDFYQSRYPLQDVFTKLVNNRGDGFEALYGTRNFRAVLSGVVYRGGANNAYNKYKKRDNSNPLPPEGLENLCKEGFATAIYLYPTNYELAAHSAACQSVRTGQDHSLQYLQKSPFNSSQRKEMLRLVRDILSGNTEGPLYLHCWNGWHASGFISALILRQYCGFTAEQAVDYWNKNTDGVNVGSAYDSIREQLRKFTPIAELTVSDDIRGRVCPQIK